MSNKRLLEELRRLTPNLKFNEMGEEDPHSMKDIVRPEDRYKEDDDEFSDEDDDSDDEESDEYEDDHEEGMEDEDGETEDIHAINILKNAYNSSEDEVRNAIVSLAHLIVENDIDVQSIKDFLDEVDNESDEDEFGDFDDEDEFGEESDEHEEGKEHEEDEEGKEHEEGEEHEEENESFDEEFGDTFKNIKFMNEGSVYAEYDSLDIGDMLD